jgi:hypothetical protein
MAINLNGTGSITGLTSISAPGISGVPVGSASAPAFSFTGDSNTGIYSPGADQVAISTNGTGRLFIDSSGRLGLGTSSPSAPLHVKSTNPQVIVDSSDSSTESRIRWYKNGSSVGAIYSDSGNLRILSESAIAFTVAGGSPSESARIDSSGRLLVGTSSARSNFFNGSVSAAFQVEGTSSDTRRVAIISSDTSAAGNGAYLLLARQINGSIGGNQAVTNGDSLGAVSFQGSDGTEFVEGARIEAVADAATSANDVPTRLVFSTTADGASSPTERMRITNAGRVLFGATAPSAENELFSFQGSNGTLSMFNVTGGASQWPIRCWNTAASGTINQILFMDGGGTARGSITTNASSTAYNTTSDYRLKENVELLAGATERLSQIPVHRFNFIGSDATVDGFLAHEVQAIVPECVTGTKDEVDADGNPVYQGIDQSKLVPLLTAALQEALAEIESLKARVTAAGI